jgi:hypothetical protein
VGPLLRCFRPAPDCRVMRLLVYIPMTLVLVLV